MSPRESKQQASQAQLIQQKKLRQKLGDVSAMWLFRHRDELPAPVLISGRRFWREEEVDAFIEKLLSARRGNEHRCLGDTP